MLPHRALGRIGGTTGEAPDRTRRRLEVQAQTSERFRVAHEESVASAIPCLPFCCFCSPFPSPPFSEQ
eukprot:3544436-Amphidinium_carterae.1